MEVKEYAPIIIPTLNRYEHLRQVLGSLEKCTGVDKTEIYISIDYPPNEKYVEGYKKVKELVENYDFSAFKAYHICCQEKNLGACGNSDFLVDLMIEKGYKKYIYTEDDNVFSNNFLEYINKNLEEFKEEKRLFAVCGFSDTAHEKGENNLLATDAFSGYGFGQWIDRIQEVREWLKRENLEKMLWDDNTRKFFYEEKYKKYWILIRALLEKQNGWNPLFIDRQGKFELIDHIYLLFMEEKGMFCIYPTVSKVRNIGCDGSGLHVFENARFDEVEVDESDSYEPVYVRPIEVNPKDVKESNSDIYQIVDVKKSKKHYRRMCFIYMHINKTLARNVEDFIQRQSHNLWRLKTKQDTVGNLIMRKIKR